MTIEQAIEGGGGATPSSDICKDLKSYVTTNGEQINRAVFAFSVWLATLLLFNLLSQFAIGEPLWGFAIGTATWAILVTQTLHFFMVSVPEVCGLIVINLFKKPTSIDQYSSQRVHLTGLSFKFPWEQAKDGMYINLRIVIQIFMEDFSSRGHSTEKTPTGRAKAGVAGGGPKISTVGSIVYRPLYALLPRYVAVDGQTINRGFVDITTSYLSTEIAKLTPEKARTSIAKLQKGVKRYFEKTDPFLEKSHELEGCPPEVKTTEFVYGVDVIAINIADVEHEASYQTTLTSASRAFRISEIAERLGLEKKDAMNAALIINGDVKKEVFELEGNAHQALAALLASWGGGNNGGSSRQSRTPSQQGRS